MIDGLRIDYYELLYGMRYNSFIDYMEFLDRETGCSFFFYRGKLYVGDYIDRYAEIKVKELRNK